MDSPPNKDFLDFFSVEFTSHVLRSFAVSRFESNLERAYESVVELGNVLVTFYLILALAK